MFESMSQRIARNPRKTIAAWVVVAVVGFLVAIIGVTGQGLFDRLASGEPAVAGSESEAGGEILASQGQSGEAITLLVSKVEPSNNELADTMAKFNTDLAAIPHVISVIDPFVVPEGVKSPGAAPLLAESEDGFLLVVELDPALESEARKEARSAVITELNTAEERIAPTYSDVVAQVGGNALIEKAVTDQVKQDLTTGETIALPIALIVMVLVFGGFIAAALPMAAALASIGSGFGVLYLLSYPMDIDGSVVNIITLLSIGLSIDYGLLIVSRFREEIARAQAADALNTTPAPSRRRKKRRRVDPVVLDALIVTMQTAGRTVAFSAVTVAISVAGLMVFSPEILRAIGASGLAIVLLAVATATTLVPALLVLSGRRLASPGVLHKVPFLSKVLKRTADVESDVGLFSKLATRVQRRPWWVLGGAVVLLAVMMIPISGMHLRNSGIGLLPTDAPQRQFVTTLATEYPAASSADLTVVVAGNMPDVEQFAKEIGVAKHVESASTPQVLGSYLVIGVDVVGTDPGGPDANAAVQEIRKMQPSSDIEYWVTGQAAGQVDFVSALGDRIWWAAGIVIVATFVLLFLMTSSVVMPIKALLTNAASLTAALGVLVWVFQDGHFSGLLNFQSTGGLETYVVAIVIAFAFGLAMDYEVFLLARIKELHDSGLDNNAAVRVGLQRSGRIITSAAAIIVVVFAGFIFGELLVIKQVGFALAFAVALDATLVRMLLVPATMTVLGEYNWWAPAPLKKFADRFSLSH